MSGPKRHIKTDAEWGAFLASENIQAWYHPRIVQRRWKWLSKLLRPRGFSRPDNLDGPTDGDVIYLQQSVVAATRSAIRLWKRDGRIPPLLWMKMNVAPHEFSHCLVDWTPTLEQLEVYDHPNVWHDAIPHAFSTGNAINAFTGLLRLHIKPTGVWNDFVAWWEAQDIALELSA